MAVPVPWTVYAVTRVAGEGSFDERLTARGVVYANAVVNDGTLSMLVESDDAVDLGDVLACDPQAGYRVTKIDGVLGARKKTLTLELLERPIWPVK